MNASVLWDIASRAKIECKDRKFYLVRERSLSNPYLTIILRGRAGYQVIDNQLGA